MTDYYAVLGVRPGATTREIKTAFREKAKRLHPDLSKNRTGKSMRELLDAYETLRHAVRRREYDFLYKEIFEHYVFDYHSFLLEDIENPETKAKLIFFDLLHGFEDEAVRVYFEAKSDLAWRLDKYLDREDTMDFSFILAEELERRDFFDEAFHLFLHIAREEAKKPYFRHFFPEVLLKLKVLANSKLAKVLSGSELLPYLETMLSVGLGKRETAWYEKRIAAIRGVPFDFRGLWRPPTGQKQP